MKTAAQRMIAQRRLALVTERTKLQLGNEAPVDEPRMLHAGCGVAASEADWSVLFPWPVLQSGEVLFVQRRQPVFDFAAFQTDMRTMIYEACRIPPELLRPMLHGELI